MQILCNFQKKPVFYRLNFAKIAKKCKFVDIDLQDFVEKSLKIAKNVSGHLFFLEPPPPMVRNGGGVGIVANKVLFRYGRTPLIYGGFLWEYMAK